MSVKPRYHPGTVDVSDLNKISEEVLDEATELYDLTYRTMMEVFPDPLSRQEADDLLANIDLEAMTAIVVGDPEQAREVLKRKFEEAR